MEDVDIKGDLQNMSMIGDCTYDFLLCSHVLEHIPDDLKAMKEIYRMLKDGGRAIIMVPIVKKLNDIIEDPTMNDIALRWQNFGQDDHIRLYSQKGLIERLSSVGFNVEKIMSSFIDTDLDRIGVDKDFVLYLGRK